MTSWLGDSASETHQQPAAQRYDVGRRHYLFEIMQFTDPKHPPGQPIIEQKLGAYELESEAVEVARNSMENYVASTGDDYVWWIVRAEGSTLARWIADSRDQQEYVLDLRSGQLVPLE